MNIDFSQIDEAVTDLRKHKIKKILAESYDAIKEKQQFCIDEDKMIIIGYKENGVLVIQRIHDNVYKLK